ncbi:MULTISPECIES: hypothetical protein [unclassified Psychrobacter]|uniref:hypothetical protein n=1 Tax=unclassified Psychrobacter TaxID=196806 RepID=UPI0025B3ED0C|nr:MULTISPECIES: hypothetical protein [unclassified Psychrobacter]MDN3453531.1 hypothetical protein [Psychrobacter sp. APC 3350]MDN3502576.1 hypothetical protein [Psychrobacter sp. 5A.1]
MTPKNKKYVTYLVLFILSVSLINSPYFGAFGPTLSLLTLLFFLIAGLLFSVLNIFSRGYKKLSSYMPLVIFPIVTVTALYLSAIGMGNQAHFLLNKSNLQAIDTLSQEANIYEMSDMRRHHKMLNDQLISNDDKYKTEKEIATAYAGTIMADNLDTRKVAKLRKKLDRSGIVHMAREDGYLVLTMGGFLDNEFGYLKAPNDDIEVGYMIPPYGLTVISLTELHDGWYFYYTT